MICNKYFRRLLAWCPQGSLRRTILFQVARTIPTPASNSISFIVALALGLSIVLQAFFGITHLSVGGENTVTGVFHLISIPLFCLVGYFFLRWIQLSHIEFKVDTMIPLTFGLYALYTLITQLNGLPLILTPSAYQSLVEILLSVSINGLQILFGVALFKLSASILNNQEWNRQNLQLAIVSVASYGLIDPLRLVGVFSDIYHLSQSGTPIYTVSLLSINLVVEELAVLILLIDLLLTKKLRNNTIYLVFLLVGASRVLSNILPLQQNLSELSWIFSRGFLLPSFVQTVVYVITGIPAILSYVIMAEVALLFFKYKEFRRATCLLSITAILLYVTSRVIRLFYGIPNTLYSLAAQPQFIYPQALNTPISIMDIPYLIALLTIAVLLVKNYQHSSPLPVESRHHPLRTYMSFLALAILLVASPNLIIGISNIVALSSHRIYFDDLTVQRGERLIFTESFNSSDLKSTGWCVNGPEILVQQDYFHSSPSSLSMSRQQKSSIGVVHALQIEAGWTILNCTAWVMVPRMQVPEGEPTHFTDIMLRSNASIVSGGVYLGRYENDTGFCYIGLITNNPDGHMYNTSTILTPYRWYRLSLVANRTSSQICLYLDQAVVAQLPLNVSSFNNFKEISIWGWI